MKATQEEKALKINGFFALLVFVVLIGWNIYGLLANAVRTNTPPIFNILALVFLFFIIGGFCIIKPNEAAVLTFFGKYIGTITENGFWYRNPFSSIQKISLKVRNLESAKIKVNDAHGNPIEIAAVIVWNVVNSASSLFDVENYEDYVLIQSETSVRTLASHYPYDGDGVEISLRGNPDNVFQTLKNDLKGRLKTAGVDILDARLTHLAYSPEIAQAMLRRQQAQAIISARQKIVEGAVGMVEMALNKLSEKKIVELDDERKAIMVNNLLVTLVSENETKPVINTGTIY